MFCCTVSVSILSSELDLAQAFDGIGKARRFEEYIHYCSLFAFSLLRETLAEISPEKKISPIEEDYFLRLHNCSTCQSI